MRIEILINKQNHVDDHTLTNLQHELTRKIHPDYPQAAIRIRKGSVNSLELSGFKNSEDKVRVAEIIQQVWEDDSWLN